MPRGIPAARGGRGARGARRARGARGGRGGLAAIADANDNVQEDAVSEASSFPPGTHFRLPSIEDISSDAESNSSVIVQASHRKRTRHEDIPSDLNQLLDQQVQLTSRIKALTSEMQTQPSTSAFRAPSVSHLYQGTAPTFNSLTVTPAHSARSFITRVELPAITSELATRCKSLVKHVHLPDLLPYNRDIDQSVHHHSSVDSSRVQITNIVEWVRAFVVFAAHRTAEHPQLTLPLWNYVDLITSMSERDEPWITYDEKFRQYAVYHPDDPSIWCHIHDKSYQDAKPRLHVTARLGFPSASSPYPKGSCFKCGKPNWNYTHRCDRSFNQPFRPAAAATAAFGDVCINWNNGRCFFPGCSRRHICSICADFGRVVAEHNARNHPKVQYKAPDEFNSKPVNQNAP